VLDSSMARVAIKRVDLVLARICGTIATHEKCHETAYERRVVLATLSFEHSL